MATREQELVGATPTPTHRAPAIVRRQPGKAELDPHRHRIRRRRIERGLAVAVPIVLFLLWQLAASADAIDTRFFPAPSTIWSTGVDLVRDGQLQQDIRASFGRIIIGFVAGSAVGVFVGIAMGMIRMIRAAFEPLMYALWTVPKLAVLPLLLLIFGLGETPMRILVAINCFFLALIPTIAAVGSVPEAFHEAALSFKATRWQVLRHVVLPAALPQIFVGLRLAAGASVLVVVAAEFVQGNTGLGHLIWNSWTLFLADRMYVGIVVVAVTGAAFTLLVAAIGRKLAPWGSD